MRYAPTARMLLCVLVGAGLLPLAATPAAAAATAPAAERVLVERINQARAEAGLGSVAVDAHLATVARGWTGQMAEARTLSHNPDLDKQVRLAWTRLGENVGQAGQSGVSDEVLADRLHTAFMGSPRHHENIMGDYTLVGVGAERDGAMLWVTVNFAKASSRTPASVAEALRVSSQVFADAADPSTGARKAAYAVVGRADVFADALGGAGLAGDRAPILFTPGPDTVDPDPALDPGVRAEIDRVLGGRGRVYLLGGTGAVPARAAAELAAGGYEVRRLAGASRVETSLAVADELAQIAGAPAEILIARADDWADAVTGGAYAAWSGSPVVLTGRDSVHPALAGYLSRHAGAHRWALGGASALSDAVVAGARAQRVSGPDRSATAVAIAERLWRRTAAAQGDGFVASPGWSSDGWAYALALAPWSAANRGPALLVGDSVPPAVSAYLARLGYGEGARAAVQPASVVPEAVTQQVLALVS